MSSAPYNCTGPQPPLSVNTDITGYGVIVNYVATAGIAVLIIIVYLLVVHNPALDPFRKAGQVSTGSFCPNPVDEIILRTVRRIPKRWMNARWIDPSSRIDSSFIKCILAMGDLQIITGVSILISGFVQLRQGLSTYHWMVIVDLAWFSSLTHLSCLTLLRNHLYNHSLERRWRLFSMTALAVLLVVALSFTGGYDWVSSVEPGTLTEKGRLTITDPAMCHLGPTSRSNTTYWAMVLSIVLIVFGFVTRVIKLYRVSINLVGQARDWLSTWFRYFLRVIFTWSCSESSRKSLKRTLCYRPLLTIFLVARLLLDGWSSMFLEVMWLVVGFLWGVFRLIAALQLQDDMQLIQDSGYINGNWGFGQVVAIVLLLAPLITIIECFDHGTTDTSNAANQGSTCDSLPHAIPRTTLSTLSRTCENYKDLDEPNNDWDDHVQILGTAIIYVITTCVIISALVYSNDTDLVHSLRFWDLPIAIASIGLFEVILFALMIETDLAKTPSWCRKLLQLVNILFFLTSAFFPALKQLLASYGWYYSFAWIGAYSFLISAAFFYTLCAIAWRVLG